MADTRPERRFTRIDRLPPYVFNITAELKMAARRRGEDIIDFSHSAVTARHFPLVSGSLRR